MESRRTWDRMMRSSSSSRAYEKTSVLLLGWTDDNDDTETTSELLTLQTTLQESYGFPVRFERMHTLIDPQDQAEKHVADFVDEEGTRGHLLIVYYAGHGKASSDDRLLLTGNQAEDETTRDMSIDWTEIEVLLGKAKADVLVILDCCCAGVLSRSTRRSTRVKRKKFQYIAACKADQKTKSAGSDSFTSAVIWALKELANEPGFTTGQLVRTLTAYEHFPRETQEAFVFGRRYGLGGDILLAPATERVTEIASEAKQKRSDDERPAADIPNPRLHFADHAPDSAIKTDRARHWLNIVRRKETAMHVGPDLPAKEVKAFTKHDGPARDQNAGLLHLIRRTANLVFDGRGAVHVPAAWHDTAFVVA